MKNRKFSVSFSFNRSTKNFSRYCISSFSVSTFVVRPRCSTIQMARCGVRAAEEMSLCDSVLLFNGSKCHCLLSSGRNRYACIALWESENLMFTEAKYLLRGGRGGYYDLVTFWTSADVETKRNESAMNITWKICGRIHDRQQAVSAEQ